MAVKLSKKRSQAMIDAILPPDSKKMILHGCIGDPPIVNHFLVVNDQVICWSENLAEIEAAAAGRFHFTYEPVPSPEEQLLRRQTEARKQRELERFNDRKRRLMAQVLKMGEGKQLRAVQMRNVLKSLGLRRVQEATTQAQLNRIGTLVGAWKLFDKARSDV